MKLKTRTEAGQVVVLLLIILCILGGGVWWLFRSKKESENGARVFARDAAAQLAMRFDSKFLDYRLSPEARLTYPPSFRERMVTHFREMGTPTRELEADGNVTFTSYFFEPKGQFRVHIQYPIRAADLDIGVSNRPGWWQIDTLNVTWDQPPAATPAPIAPAVPTATPSP